MKKILILVAGESNLPLIMTARNLGFYVITCDNNPNNPGHQFANENLIIDVYDYKAIIDSLENRKIDFVFTFVSSHGLESAAKISEHFGLKGYSFRNLKVLMNKDLFREFLRNNYLDCPSFIVATHEEVIDLESLKFPVILKPVDGGGSIGVQKANTLDEAKYYFPLSKNASNSGRVIIEEFIDSKKLINGDCLIRDHQIIAAVIGDYFYDPNLSEVLPIATLFPTEHNTVRTLEQLSKIIKKLDIPDGLINFEAILFEDKSYIIEINPRPSGNYLWKILEYKYGVCIPGILLKMCTGQKLPEILPDDNSYAYQLIYSDRNTIYKNFTLPRQIETMLQHVEMFKQPGDEVEKLTNLYQRVGITLLKFENTEVGRNIIKNQDSFKLKTINYNFPIILPEDFVIHYGSLKMRLVNENDADFIVSLRSNPQLTKYMVTLSDDIAKQKEWIANYKLLEREGKDYYFIFEIEEKKMGVLRISYIDMNGKTAKAANWIKIPSERSVTVKMFTLWFFVIFDVLKLDSFYSDVHKDNERSLRYFKEYNFSCSNNPNENEHFDIVGTRKDYDSGLNKILNRQKVSSNYEVL